MTSSNNECYVNVLLSVDSFFLGKTFKANLSETFSRTVDSPHGQVSKDNF